MSELDSLDKTCEKIFLFLGLTQRKLGFNDLYRSLDKSGFRISKPTLSEHLKHLTEKKVLIKKRVGTQKVSYEINWDNFQHLLKSLEKGRKMKEKFLDDGNYIKLSIEEQMILTNYTMSYVTLEQLRLSILSILKPENKFEYNLELMFIWRYFDLYKSVLLEFVKEDREGFGKQILQLIEKELEVYYSRLNIANK